MSDEGRCAGCGQVRPATRRGPLPGLPGPRGSGQSRSTPHDVTVTFGPAFSEALSELAESVAGLPRISCATPAGGRRRADRAARLARPTPARRRHWPISALRRDRPRRDGAVIKARDPDLGRDLALKVLLEKHKDHPELIRRFLEEAQIAGQLQHPGIVPVYELGAFPIAGRIFAMKLVKGRTLAELLAERATRLRDLPRFLGDLRAGLPDDGLCPCPRRDPPRPEALQRDGRRVRRGPGDGLGPRQGPPPGRRGRDAAAGQVKDRETVIATARSGRTRSRSFAGRLGARHPGVHGPRAGPRRDRHIDERADVFALGSILCEILTGEPAFTGPDRRVRFTARLQGGT